MDDFVGLWLKYIFELFSSSEHSEQKVGKFAYRFFSKGKKTQQWWGGIQRPAPSCTRGLI